MVNETVQMFGADFLKKLEENQLFLEPREGGELAPSPAWVVSKPEEVRIPFLAYLRLFL